VVVDDYGHHPTEIAATLAGARQCYADRRVVAVLQPHRYTRLRDNFEGFVGCLDHAQLVVLTEIYSAGEAPLPGVTIDALAERLRARDPARAVVVEQDFERVPERVAEHVTAGDVVLTLGAGSITRVGPRLLERLGLDGR
jgi:UDP-N-acetylmuramate--alanine ligase